MDPIPHENPMYVCPQKRGTSWYYPRKVDKPIKNFTIFGVEFP
jgi:hypothetical protein